MGRLLPTKHILLCACRAT